MLAPSSAASWSPYKGCVSCVLSAWFLSYRHLDERYSYCILIGLYVVVDHIQFGLGKFCTRPFGVHTVLISCSIKDIYSLYHYWVDNFLFIFFILIFLNSLAEPCKWRVTWSDSYSTCRVTWSDSYSTCHVCWHQAGRPLYLFYAHAHVPHVFTVFVVTASKCLLEKGRTRQTFWGMIYKTRRVSPRW